MNKLVILLLISYSSSSLLAQDLRKFEFKKSDFGSYIVTLSSDSNLIVGDLCIPHWTDQTYIDSLIYSTIMVSIPDEILKKGNLKSVFNLYIIPDGSIASVRFTIPERDLDIISEEELYQLHTNLMKIRLDPKKVILTPYEYSGVKECGYGVLSGLILPKEYRRHR